VEAERAREVKTPDAHLHTNSRPICFHVGISDDYRDKIQTSCARIRTDKPGGASREALGLPPKVLSALREVPSSDVARLHCRRASDASLAYRSGGVMLCPCLASRSYLADRSIGSSAARKRRIHRNTTGSDVSTVRAVSRARKGMREDRVDWIRQPAMTRYIARRSTGSNGAGR
jgi:hypothetical protein